MSCDLYWADNTPIGSFESVIEAQSAAAARVEVGKSIKWRNGPSKLVWWGYVDGDPTFVIKDKRHSYS